MPLRKIHTSEIKNENPKGRPFIDPDEREREAAAWVNKFIWDKTIGVLIDVELTNPAPHKFIAANFTSDSDYTKVVEEEKLFRFKPQHRGGSKNPAIITGIAYCAGSFTSKPAFKKLKKLPAIL